MESNESSTQPSSQSSIQLTEAEVLQTLTGGEMEEKGLLPYSSNHSFLITVADDKRTLPAVYKPRHGESPLWDFEWGSLCLRETAAYQISQGLGWDLVPPTVLREGTRGIGSVQFYVQNDEEEHYFTIQSDARYADTLRQLALFDYIINNADRKSGHCLISPDGRLWAIDHGVCFHTDYKLRTVIWEFSNEPIEGELHADLLHFRQQLQDRRSVLSEILCQLLNADEFRELVNRVRYLLNANSFPAPPPQRRNYPWPPI